MDVAARAVEQALAAAVEAGVDAMFVVGDALELADATGVLAGPFDYVLDVGLFHVLQPADQRALRRVPATVVRPR